MKRIGLIGGVSPESTIIYYQLLNRAAAQRYDARASAEVVIHALNFGQMHALYAKQDWDAFKAIVVEAARGLAVNGCELIGILSNTTQIAARQAAAAIDVPLVNLIDCLASAMRKAGVKRPLLLGTPFVMTGDFYRPELKQRHGFECLIPDAEGRDIVDRVIFEELVKGQVKPQSRAAYLEIMDKGVAQGADAVILGCTEIGMLISQTHTDIAVFDTTHIHAAALAEAAFVPA